MSTIEAIVTAPEPPSQRARWMHAVRAVLWSFFGVRKGAEHDADAHRLNPLHVIVVAVAAAIALIVILLTIVHFVVAR